MEKRTLIGLFLALALGCSKKAADGAVDAGVKHAAVAVAPTMHHGLPWYADAPGAALDAARTADKLVLVDLWAAWCHTCLSMRAYVLTSEHLAGVRERLVFLAIDTEQAANAKVLERLPIAAWPTFYLIDADYRVYGRLIGAAAPAQLTAFVRDGLRAFDAAKQGTLPPDDPLALAIDGDRLAASGKLLEARDHYQRALGGAAIDWPRRPDVLVALAGTLRKLGQHDACVDLGLRELAHTGDSASATDFAFHQRACAASLDPHDARGVRIDDAIDARIAPLCMDGSAAMTPDDRGDACGLLRELRRDRKDEAGARAVTEKRLAVLRDAARDVPDEIALTYDFARMESLLALGRGEEAVALLRAREKALPDDYNPPHYLARTYRELGRFDEGLAAIERALAKASGPRRAGILGVKVDLLLGKDARTEARQVLEAQLAAYRALPAGQKQPAREEAVQKRLRDWK